MAKVTIDEDALKEFVRPLIEGRDDSTYLIEQLLNLTETVDEAGSEGTTYTEEEHLLALEGQRAELQAEHRAEVERLFFVGVEKTEEPDDEPDEDEESSFEFAEDVNWS